MGSLLILIRGSIMIYVIFCYKLIFQLKMILNLKNIFLLYYEIYL